MKNAEFQAVDLDVLVRILGAIIDTYCYISVWNMGPKEQSQNICLGLEASTYPPDVTPQYMNVLFPLCWPGGNRGKEASSRGKTGEIKETL